jgi:uncharacterized phage protein (TIGR01671 family)
MRNLEFRAWNPQTKKMSYDVTLYANGWTECVYDSGMSIKHDPTELIVMQWSGLKDKKGNKIFDGDIVKVIDMPSSPHEKTYITNVIYKDGCFFLSDVGGLEIPLFETLKESYPNGYLSLIIYKVIGNIYESDDEFICPKCKTTIEWLERNAKEIQ